METTPSSSEILCWRVWKLQWPGGDREHSTGAHILFNTAPTNQPTTHYHWDTQRSETLEAPSYLSVIKLMNPDEENRHHHSLECQCPVPAKSLLGDFKHNRPPTPGCSEEIFDVRMRLIGSVLMPCPRLRQERKKPPELMIRTCRYVDCITGLPPSTSSYPFQSRKRRK